MREGLYRVHFETTVGFGTGVVFAKEGRIWGGDSSMYYCGTYEERGERVIARLNIGKHTITIGRSRPLLARGATTIIEGRVSGDVITASGSSPQAPGDRFTAILTHLLE